MTPKKKTRNSTTLMMERKVVLPDGKEGKVHIAGGTNAGIVVNKGGAAAPTGANGGDDNPAHLFLEFRVFLVNANTKRFTQEKRRISFWFKEAFHESQRAYAAQEFFKKLVSPTDFPRGMVYVYEVCVHISISHVLTYDIKICLKSPCTAFTALLALIEVQGPLRHILFLLQITLGSSRR